MTHHMEAAAATWLTLTAMAAVAALLASQPAVAQQRLTMQDCRQALRLGPTVIRPEIQTACRAALETLAPGEDGTRSGLRPPGTLPPAATGPGTMPGGGGTPIADVDLDLGGDGLGLSADAGGRGLVRAGIGESAAGSPQGSSLVDVQVGGDREASGSLVGATINGDGIGVNLGGLSLSLP